MKHFLILLLTVTVSFTGVIAQKTLNRELYAEEGDWIIGVGVNVVDDSGLIFKELFNAKDNWNFGTPIQATIEYRASSYGSIQASFSMNKYNEGKKINGEIVMEGGEATYFAFDINAKYSFGEKWNTVEPYLLLGGGYTNIGEYTTDLGTTEEKGRGTINLGLGVNYWFTGKWGINLNLLGKIGMGKYNDGISVFNQKQYSLGILYAIK